jgi:hypothetical protein
MRALVTVVLGLAFTPAASAGLPNPCALLTNAEVAKVLGSKVVARDTLGNRLYRSCKWTGADLGGYYPSKRKLLLQVTKATKAQFEQAARTTHAATRVNGVGEAAFAMPQSGGGFLNVYAHGFGLELNAALVTSPLDAEMSAAKLALTRL